MELVFDLIVSLSSGGLVDTTPRGVYMRTIGSSYLCNKRSFYFRLLRGTIVNRTYGTHKNIHV